MKKSIYYVNGQFTKAESVRAAVNNVKEIVSTSNGVLTKAQEKEQEMMKIFVG